MTIERIRNGVVIKFRGWYLSIRWAKSCPDCGGPIDMVFGGWLVCSDYECPGCPSSNELQAPDEPALDPVD